VLLPAEPRLTVNGAASCFNNTKVILLVLRNQDMVSLALVREETNAHHPNPVATVAPGNTLAEEHAVHESWQGGVGAALSH
jgi:hypothetical protein